jgi:hypothetical protein
VRLLIERAGADHLGAGASVALLGGVLLYLAGLIGTRTVVVRSQHRLGLSLKLAAAAIIVALLAAETALPPLAVAAGLVGVLTAVVYLDRTLLEQTQQPARAQNP